MQIVIDLGDRRVRRLAALVVAAALIWWVADSVVNAAVPNTFNPGDVISSADVNENFTDLDSRVTALAAGQVPIGTIIDYWTFNQTLSIPAGFEVCDGSNVSTSGSPIFGQQKPDLLDRFVKGKVDAGAEGDTGGSDQLNLSHAHGMEHFHDGTTITQGPPSALTNVVTSVSGSGVTVTSTTVGSNSHIHSLLVGSTSGLSTASTFGTFNNEPPFLTVLKIIRVK